MAQADWYVVQVQTGFEQRMCALIERICAESDLESDLDGYQLLQECFSPRFKTQRKRMGQWRDVEHPLLPGYVVAVTDNPAKLANLLRGVRDFARVLAVGETYVPLSKEERLWLSDQTHPGERVVPMSIGCKVGDKLQVTSGPLVGREWMVERVDRKNSLAHVALHVGQMTFKTTVGLGIVPEKERRSE